MKLNLGPNTNLFPLPSVLVTSKWDGKANIITIGWISICSMTPPMIMIALNPLRYSYGMIKLAKEFVVNIPTADMAPVVDFCGVKSGKDTDKFEATGLTAIVAKKVGAPLIKECPYNIECKLTKVLETGGSHGLFIGEIVETHMDKDKAIMDGDKPLPDFAKLDPLIYATNIREYWSIGEKVGDAYDAWKKLSDVR